MKIPAGLFIFLIICGLILLSGCSRPAPDTENPEESQRIARDFLMNSPTFKYDGKPHSVKLVEISKTETEEKGNNKVVRYTFIYKFTCLHAGYGDRTGQKLPRIETPHTARIVIENGKAISASIDNKWDMLAQAMYYTRAKEEGIIIAEEFIKNSPTYSFDGVPGTIKLIDTIDLRCPSCWQFKLQFECTHAGYGDRAGQVLTPVITKHEAVIIVEEGNIKSAILDTIWDMISQSTVENYETRGQINEESCQFVGRDSVTVSTAGFPIVVLGNFLSANGRTERVAS